MRYYAIKITDPKTGAAPPLFPAVAGANISGATFTSFLDGKTDPGALNVELDIQTTDYATPAGGSFVRVWGISLQQIAQAANLNRMNLEIYAGMAPGLPLATAAVNANQQGLLVKGSVYPAFGNWIGVDMTLDLIVSPAVGSADKDGAPAPYGDPFSPANIIHNWRRNTSLSDAIATTLKTAFPKLTMKINISSNLKLSRDDAGFYSNLTQYAQYLKAVSKSIIKTDSYSGVLVNVDGDTIVVSDNIGTQSSPKTIAFTDLIGQPTWYGVNTIQFKTMMRADIKVNDSIVMPTTIGMTTAASAPQFRSNSGFQGTFQVIGVRHVGNFRQPDAASWCTIFEAVQSPSSSGKGMAATGTPSFEFGT